MSIEQVDVKPFDIPLLAPFTIASAELTHVRNIVVTVTLQNGISGYGEGAVLPPVTRETQDIALSVAGKQIEYLLGFDVGSWRRLGLELLQRIPQYPSVRAAIEMALIDALTRSWDIPLHLFFGGVTDTVFTDITIPICYPVEARSLAEKYCRRGFETIKTKVGLDLSEDLERLQAIRAGHPGCRLVLDANEGYTVDQSLQLLDCLKARGIQVALFEQPVSRENWSGMSQLTREAGTLIAADESCRSSSDALRIVKQRAADVINIKLAKSGVVQALEIAAVARCGGVGLMIGEMVETRLSTGFAAGLAAGLGGFDWFDLDTPLLLAADPVTGGYRQDGSRYILNKSQAGHGSRPF